MTAEQPFKVIISGSSSFNDFEQMIHDCDYMLQNKKQVTVLTGTCSGADLYAEYYAKRKNLPVIKYPADYGKYGMRANALRNLEMIQDADAALIFWDGTSSNGKSLIDLCITHNIKHKVYEFNRNPIIARTEMDSSDQTITRFDSKRFG